MMTEQEILDDIINSNNISEEDLEYIRTSDPIMLHHGFGTWIRNHYKLWEVPFEPELRDGVDYSPNHPDAISQRIVVRFHDHLNSKSNANI